LKKKLPNLNGGARIIPKYHGSDNTPFVNNEEKRAKTVHYEDKQALEKIKASKIKPRPDPKTMIQMTINDNILGQPPEMKPNTVYPSQYVPVPNPNNPIASTYTVPWNFNSYNVPIIKKYNISLAGADGNLTSVGEIFEDILPAAQVGVNRFTTLSERLILYSYIRSILIKSSEGEEIAIGDHKNSKPEIINLLSYMKMLEMNPYHFSRLTNNHYRTMPDNFVMFKSCYPIRLEKSINVIKCAKEAVNTNIRIYILATKSFLKLAI
jgi:hypothetical protein